MCCFSVLQAAHRKAPTPKYQVCILVFTSLYNVLVHYDLLILLSYIKNTEFVSSLLSWLSIKNWHSYIWSLPPNCVSTNNSVWLLCKKSFLSFCHFFTCKRCTTTLYQHITQTSRLITLYCRRHFCLIKFALPSTQWTNPHKTECNIITSLQGKTILLWMRNRWQW